ncbi:MAG: hypothetical protein B6I20_02830 [Bacteroidetes bacterium 4572_117]|nr:MAG: hypothetical protein B6I20_02830 [Bacteroidetes bacterium 4572_117]
MKVIIFGATGMVGQCVLVECLKSPAITKILVVGRRTCGVKNIKTREILHNNFLDYSAIENELIGYNACFYCLGVSSVGLSNKKYYDITYNYTVAIAEILTKQNPNINFAFISGAGTDETEKCRINWANIKGKAENMLRKYPFKSLSLFRPAYIKALEGVEPSYSLNKYFDWFFYPFLKTFFPKAVITSKELGMAMINSMYQKEEVKIIENVDIKKLAYLNL